MASLDRDRGWECIWSGAGPLDEYWRYPEPAVETWADGRPWKDTARRALDLGCGPGRHILALARQGLSVTATDISPAGLAICAARLGHEGVVANLACHAMERLPFSPRSFGALLAYHVIYHTTLAGMRRVLAEMRRVLLPGGCFYITFIARDDSKVAGYRRDMQKGKCQEIEPFTFVYLHDAPGDKALPHHYCDEAQVRHLLADFVVDSLSLDRREYTDEAGEAHVGVHYHVQGRSL